MVRTFFYLWGILALVFWLSNLAYAHFVSHESLVGWAIWYQLYTAIMFMFTVALILMLLWVLFRKKKR